MKSDLIQSPLTSHLIVAQRLLKPLQQRVSSPLLLKSSQSTAKKQRLSHLAFGEARSSNRAAWASKDSVEDRASKLVADQCSDYYNEVWSAAARIAPVYAALDRLIAKNSARVQAAFASAQVGPHHFQGSTGYGHGDLGRAALDEIMAAVMGTEAALVRMQLVSGTHAISTALFACLRPGDCMLAVAGRPYDTLEEVIGLRSSAAGGSLKDWGISYAEAPLLGDGNVDHEGLRTSLQTHKPRVALIQRSCGYALRPTLSIAQIADLTALVKEQSPDCLVLVDNCYGEFTEEREPGQVGVDLVMGSLIKSPGGTLVTGGGYIAGRRDLVARAGARATAPGVGLDSGAVPGETLRLMFQGLYLAPQTVGEALKGGRLIAEAFSARGYVVHPRSHNPDYLLQPSYITAVQLGTPEAMQTFCSAVQRSSPVGSYVRPVPGQTSGYADQVIFADGTFIDGSTSELSADGPLRDPYVIYCQGGTHWTQWALALEQVFQALWPH